MKENLANTLAENQNIKNGLLAMEENLQNKIKDYNSKNLSLSKQKDAYVEMERKLELRELRVEKLIKDKNIELELKELEQYKG